MLQDNGGKRFRIHRLLTENIKRVKVVDITPDGSVVQISGANESGKTSVLDSIWWAVGGTKGVDIEPIREGQERATIRLELGEITVTRTFYRDGDGYKTGLVVEAADGARYPSPQRLLDDLIGSLASDPLAFMRASSKDQRDIVKGLVSLPIDIDQVDRLIAGDFANRTDVNRKVKALTERVNVLAAGVDVNASVEIVDVAQLSDDMRATMAANYQLEQEAARRASVREDRERAGAKLRDLRAHIAKLLAESEQLGEVIAGVDAAIDGWEPLPASADVSALSDRIRDAERANTYARAQLDARAKHEEAKQQLLLAETSSELYTTSIEQNTKLKADTIAAAAMPVPGLSFTATGVEFNGFPLSQASSAAQLRVSFAIAVAQNPALRVIRIKDGSLLDETSLRHVADMAEEHDFQVWIERVDTSGRVGIFMEDGEVKIVEPREFDGLTAADLEGL